MIEERATYSDQPHTTTVIERRSGGGGTILIGVVLLIAVIIGAFYLMNQNRSESEQTKAITGVAEGVSEGAKKVGDAAQKAVE